MSEIDYKPTQENFVELLAEAKHSDACYVADEILETIGDDHSIDSDPLWEAKWTSDELQKHFELVKESHWDNKGGYSYWLYVTGIDEETPHAVFTFDMRHNSISLGYDDENLTEYSPVEDNDAWREIERVVNTYPHSAPAVEFTEVDIDSGWSHLFHDLIIPLALEDKAVGIYHSKCASNPDDPKLDMIETFIRKRLRNKYALPENRVEEAISIVHRSAERKHNGN